MRQHVLASNMQMRDPKLHIVMWGWSAWTQDAAQMDKAWPNPKPGLLPGLPESLLRQQQSSGLAVGQDPGLARRLLAQVERVQPAWHSRLQEAAG